MKPQEAGFLLLTSRLGNPERKCLTTAQLRVLAQRVQANPRPDADRDLQYTDLMALGYGEEMARRIVALLEEEELLNRYLRLAERKGCVPLTRLHRQYPEQLRRQLGLDATGCLWAKGDVSILEMPRISLVGSRDLLNENRQFAQEVGRQAAYQGFVLVSGNARGADRTAQEACLAAGGQVICVVADELDKQPSRERVLYLSEDGFSEEFSAARALSRNRVIHALGCKTFVAQCGYQKGGTWDGSVKNLRFGWSPVFCFRDGSAAMELLAQMGAELIDVNALKDLARLEKGEISLFV
jgi:predicted Rossmann fold nucleotide-binding protein DprA/Smf involved in DNA uptake